MNGRMMELPVQHLHMGCQGQGRLQVSSRA